MEYEDLHYDLDAGYIKEIHECSLNTTFLLQNDHPIFRNTTQDLFFDDIDIERLVQLESELMDFDFIDQDGVNGLVNELETTTWGNEMNPEFHENVEEYLELPADVNSHMKGIEDEVMNETSLTDLLLTGAEAVEAENWPLASVVITRLNDLLFDRENGKKPFNRLAIFFTQGLHFKSTKNVQELHKETIPRQQPNNTLSAFQMLQELSPYVKFAHFTANQAILEATEDSNEVHIIDFDIMEGIQFPPLMVDLSARNNVTLRITSIINFDQKTSDEIERTGKRLKQFADSIHLAFVFDQMVLQEEDDFERIEMSGQTVIANCMIHQLHMPHKGFSQVNTFLNGISKLSPKMIVLVEEELFNFTKMPSMSFVEFFCEALHHYTALSDSLTSGFCGGYKLALRVIEKEFLGKRILDSVRQFPCGNEQRKLWTNGYPSLKGFRPIPMSSYNVSQAKFLVTLFSGGYWVQHEDCRLALCWKSRPLTIASIWVPLSGKSSASVTF